MINLELKENGCINVEEIVSGVSFRRVLIPTNNISKEPEKIRAFCVKNWTDKIKSQYIKDHPEPTKDEIDFNILEVEARWIVSEFDWLIPEIQKHDYGANRPFSTRTKLINYGNKLRDYIQKGVITTETRPTRPA